MSNWKKPDFIRPHRTKTTDRVKRITITQFPILKFGMHSVNSNEREFQPLLDVTYLIFISWWSPVGWFSYTKTLTSNYWSKYTSFSDLYTMVIRYVSESWVDCRTYQVTRISFCKTKDILETRPPVEFSRKLDQGTEGCPLKLKVNDESSMSKTFTSCRPSVKESLRRIIGISVISVSSQKSRVTC